VTVRVRGRQLGGVALAVLLTFVLAVALWWGFLRDGNAAAAQGSRVTLDFAAVPDGAPPATFDNGQPLTVSQSPTDRGANFFVSRGRLSYKPTVEGPAAAYLTTGDLGAPVRSLGASWVFAPGAGSHGAIALVVSHGIRDVYPPPQAPCPIHFVATATNWNLSVLKDDSSRLEPIAAATFAKPLAEDGTTVHTVKITVTGEKAAIELPDGSRQEVRDPRISEWEGNYATFEVYSNDGQTDSIGAFERIWADARGAG
jgi:hypothetical protein